MPVMSIKNYIALGGVVLLLASCQTTGGDVKSPAMPGPDKFKEASLYESYWQPASTHAGEMDRSAWWQIFNDADLNALEDQASKNNPELQAAAARIEQAEATIRQVRSALYPNLDLTAGVTRGNLTSPRLATEYSILGTVSYGMDIFGRVRAASRVANFNRKQAKDLYQQVLLLLHADVAQNYFTLQSLDTERDLLRQTIQLRSESMKLVERRFREGESNEQDFLRAQAELSATKADLAQLDQQRAAVEHALAILLGQSPAQLTVAEKKLPAELPVIPAGLPSSMLERRPDIAAAQDALSANNARVGLARLAFFPSISLTAQGGLISNDLDGLFQTSNDAWAIGPLISLPIFDGGRRRADIALANAVYRESISDYRQRVLTAFKEVEDNLSDLRLGSERASQLYQAAQSAHKAENISRIRYREGETNFLEVLDTQRDTLAAQRAYTRTQGQRFISTINLIRALGGGWSGVSPTTTPHPEKAIETPQQTMAQPAPAPVTPPRHPVPTLTLPVVQTPKPMPSSSPPLLISPPQQGQQQPSSDAPLTRLLFD